MQTLTTPDSISGPFASGANALKNAIPNSSTGTYLASMEDGFPATTMQPTALGGTPPDGKDLNGILNKVSQHYFQFQNGYLPTFVQATSDLIGGYPSGAVLWYCPAGETKAIPVISLIGNNTYNFNTTPAYIDGTHWDYAITGNYVTTYSNQTVGGNKDFTGTVTVLTPGSATDNTTKVATTAHIVNVLKALYPVGAIFLGTTSTCPMAAFFGTWQLEASKIVVDVGSSAAIKASVGQSSATGYGKYVVAQSNSFVQETLPAYGGYNINVSTNQTIPGASATVTSTTVTLNIWRRIA